MTKVIQREI